MELYITFDGGTHGVMVILKGNWDTVTRFKILNSAVCFLRYSWERYASNYSPRSQTGFLGFGMVTCKR